MNIFKLNFEKTQAIKVLTLAAIAVLMALFGSGVALAANPHVVKFPTCTEIEGPAIQCVGGKFAGLGNEPVFVFLEAALACETRSGANQPGGHLQSDTVEIQPRNGQITLPTLTTNVANCPPGLNPVVGQTVDIVILNAAGDEIFRLTVPVL